MNFNALVSIITDRFGNAYYDPVHRTEYDDQAKFIVYNANISIDDFCGWTGSSPNEICGSAGLSYTFEENNMYYIIITCIISFEFPWS